MAERHGASVLRLARRNSRTLNASVARASACAARFVSAARYADSLTSEDISSPAGEVSSVLRPALTFLALSTTVPCSPKSAAHARASRSRSSETCGHG